jgi:hypothetical protein
MPFLFLGGPATIVLELRYQQLSVLATTSLKSAFDRCFFSKAAASPFVSGRNGLAMTKARPVRDL